MLKYEGDTVAKEITRNHSGAEYSEASSPPIGFPGGGGRGGFKQSQKEQEERSNQSWNMECEKLIPTVKLHNVIKEMELTDIDILVKLKNDKQTPKKEWMTDELLDLLEKRRQRKGHNTQKYREIHKEIEYLAARYDNFNLHKKIKQMTGLRRKRQQGIIKNKDGSIIIDLSAKLKRWKEYIRKLFYDARAERDNINTTAIVDELRITSQETKFAIRNAKVNKATEGDQNQESPTHLILYTDNVEQS
ncbi:hypothetical protein ILUMI_23837 [Ignelater luminosus]|uniref:Endonuclease-reverse transcriptase n=1 Tax=Ignelater luminosus TaxID=2038154 RepID=A0A8K0C836_IGNLU|nr:hypothetical protein ILUMI_23837 [Ignelater luminosus]